MFGKIRLKTKRFLDSLKCLYYGHESWDRGLIGEKGHSYFLVSMLYMSTSADGAVSGGNKPVFVGVCGRCLNFYLSSAHPANDQAPSPRWVPLAKETGNAPEPPEPERTRKILFVDPKNDSVN